MCLVSKFEVNGFTLYIKYLIDLLNYKIKKEKKKKKNQLLPVSLYHDIDVILFCIYFRILCAGQALNI